MSDYNNEHPYTERLRAGKRTYFFDAKQTHGGDFYIVITESRKSMQHGEPLYKKNKIFLYKEDINNFQEAFNRAIDHLKTELLPEYDFDQSRQQFHEEDGQMLNEE